TATQYLAATSRLWPVSAFLAGIAGLLAMWLYVRTRHAGSAHPEASHRAFLLAASAYAVLLVIVLLQLIPAVAAALDHVVLQPHFPATQTGLGWHNPESAGQRLS